MAQGLAGFLGGLGLFLFGMAVMTAALAELAGPVLRRRIAQATATRWRGALTGTIAATLLQSSTAVTIMSIGFVGAGVLTFQQSLGVILGANIGSTLTGWLVTLVGVKLQLASGAMLLMPAAALAVLLGGARVARAGRGLAGLLLVFIGLGTMQGAVSATSLPLPIHLLPQDGIPGRMVLVGIGTLLAMVLQSSNAGLALVVVLLGSEAVTLPQGAALVLGLNLGTSVTGQVAAIGGSREMRMTALANFLMNAVTALALFPMLGWLETWVDTSARWDAQTLLVSFHSAFNLLCTALFLPVVGLFAGWIERLVKVGRSSPADKLDQRLLSDPGIALELALQVADDVARQIGGSLLPALAADGAAARSELVGLSPQLRLTLTALEGWLAGLPALTDPRDRSAHAALMHMTDHLSRLLSRMEEVERIERIANQPGLSRAARALAAALARAVPMTRMTRIAVLSQRRAHGERHESLSAGPSVGPEVFRQTDAMRWIERLANHAGRIALHREEVRRALA